MLLYFIPFTENCLIARNLEQVNKNNSRTAHANEGKVRIHCYPSIKSFLNRHCVVNLPFLFHRSNAGIFYIIDFNPKSLQSSLLMY